MQRNNPRWTIILWGTLSLIIAACSSSPAPGIGQPRLMQDATLSSAQAQSRLPTASSNNQPTATLNPAASPQASATQQLEVISPLEQTTVEAAFVLVTPTLPPSKTPTTTITPTITISPTVPITPTVTTTVTTTATARTFPTAILATVTAPAAQPRQQTCDNPWFFTDPLPPGCPPTPPDITQGVYQTFQNGHMVWVGSLNAIYVLYNSPDFPQWEVFRDTFEESEPHFDPDWAAPPADNLWQPRRGFGKLWRNNPAVRERIGWAIMQWEEAYTINVQNDTTGSIYLDSSRGDLFALMPLRDSWSQYDAATGAIDPAITPGAFPTIPAPP